MPRSFQKPFSSQLSTMSCECAVFQVKSVYGWASSLPLRPTVRAKNATYSVKPRTQHRGILECISRVSAVENSLYEFACLLRSPYMEGPPTVEVQKGFFSYPYQSSPHNYSWSLWAILFILSSCHELFEAGVHDKLV